MIVRRALRVIRVSALVIACSAHALPANAQPAKPAKPAKPAPPPPVPAGPPSLADSLSGEAKSDYEAAKLLYRDGDFGGALVKFTAAHEKSRDPRLLWNIAACEKNLRHYSNVLAYVRRYLAEGQAVLSEDDKAEANALLKAIEPLTAVIDLSVNENGARVFVDDKPVGETPLAAPIVVDLGQRKIRVEKEGFEPYREELTIGDSPRIKLVAKLDKASTDAVLTIYTARPLDEIFLDGSLRGRGTWQGLVPSGDHTMRVTAPGMQPYQAQVPLRDKEVRTVAMTLDPEPTPEKSGISKWVWIGGGAALLVTGIVIAGVLLFQPEDEQPNLPVGTLDPGSVQASFPGAVTRSR